VHSNAGEVAVSVVDAAPGTRFRAVLDGAAAGDTRAAASFTLEGVDRGTHRLAVLLIGPRGSVIGRTAEVEFHLWHASRRMPSRRPPPP
jgi:hypothetical protein